MNEDLRLTLEQFEILGIARRRQDKCYFSNPAVWCTRMTKQAYLQGSGGRGLGHEIGMMSGKMAGRLHGQCYTELHRQLQQRNGDSEIASGCS